MASIQGGRKTWFKEGAKSSHQTRGSKCSPASCYSRGPSCQQVEELPESYKVLYGNARSVIKKLDELRCLAEDIKPDVICITETWTNLDHTEAFLTIDGFTRVCRKDRADTSAGAGGGLLIYVRSSISAPEYKKPEFESFNQCCCVKLPLFGGRHLDLVLVYRPHKLYNNDQTTEVKDNNALLGDLFAKVQRPCVLLGDFNCSDIDWSSSTSDPKSAFLLQAALDNGF